MKTQNRVIRGVFIAFAAAMVFYFASCSSGGSDGDSGGGGGSIPPEIASSSSFGESSSSATVYSSSSVQSSNSLDVSSSSFSESSSSLTTVSSSSFGESSSSSATVSSSSSVQGSSSSVTVSSSSSVQSSSSSVTVSSSSSVQSSSSVPEGCEGITFNPANKFCYGGTVYDKCDGMEYIPSSQICTNGVAAPAKCDGVGYNPLTQFCQSGTNEVKPLCSGDTYTATQECCGSSKYTLATQFCQSTNVVKDKCGTATYTSTQFCQSGTNVVKDLCGTATYTAAQFCYNSSKIVNFCGTRTETFDPDSYECRTGNKIYLKTPVSYGGENYDAVLIGTQTWMARNLNYNASGSKCGSDNTDYIGSNYLLSDANTAFCDTYGRLYNWSTAMGISNSYNSSYYNTSANTKYRGVCPSGWHIPNDAEWDVLINAVGEVIAGKYLKATNGWVENNGEDKYGFSALPGGYGSSDGSFYGVGDSGYWWSASEYNSSYAYYRNMYYYGESASFNYYKIFLYSVRCLQD
jgi:uncharacterized protein (TIGR02145 family)